MSHTFYGWLGVLWGMGGFLILIGQALYRLTPMALEALLSPLTVWQWILLIIWVGFMGISEGYRGFQKMFSPRFAARALWLQQHPRPLAVICAPLFCMGLMGATHKRLIISWCLTLGIILLVLGMRLLSQPWRGMIDTGVLFGLGWGLVTVIWFCYQVLSRRIPPVEPEISEKCLIALRD